MSDQSATRGELIFRQILDLIPVILVLGAILLGQLAGRQEGESVGIAKVRSEAILHHAAHYESDAKGNPVFTWNTSTSTPSIP